MINFLKKITGIAKIEQAKVQAEAERKAAETLAAQKLQEAIAAEEAAELAKMTPKDRATKKGEPWVGVLETHINPDNVRNGFFELDWNEYFIVQLKQAGYGFDGDPDEEIVDRWFRELAGNMLLEAGVAQPNRTIGGYINVNRLGDGRAEVE